MPLRDPDSPEPFVVAVVAFRAAGSFRTGAAPLSWPFGTAAARRSGSARRHRLVEPHVERDPTPGQLQGSRIA